MYIRVHVLCVYMNSQYTYVHILRIIYIYYGVGPLGELKHAPCVAVIISNGTLYGVYVLHVYIYVDLLPIYLGLELWLVHLCDFTRCQSCV